MAFGITIWSLLSLIELSKADRRRLTDVFAPWMFGCSLVFLALVAADVVLVIDVPRVNEAVSGNDEPMKLVEIEQLALDRELAYETLSHRWGTPIGIAMLCLWPGFLVEFVKDFWLRDRSLPFLEQHPFAWLFCLFPPFRLCRRRA